MMGMSWIQLLSVCMNFSSNTVRLYNSSFTVLPELPKIFFWLLLFEHAESCFCVPKIIQISRTKPVKKEPINCQRNEGFSFLGPFETGTWVIYSNQAWSLSSQKACNRTFHAIPLYSIHSIYLWLGDGFLAFFHIGWKPVMLYKSRSL